MTLTITPVLAPDVPTFVHIELEAFKSHPRIPMLWPKGYTSDLYAYMENGKRDSLADPESQIIKAVDNSTGDIAAVAEWMFCLDVEKQLQKDAVDPNGGPPLNWPQGGNWEMKRFYSLNLEKWTKRYLIGKPYIKLEFLVVHPSRQRQGLGAKLMTWGTEQADRLDVVMALEATPAGMALYKRFGFVEKEIVAADMRQFGWMEPYDPEAAKRVWMVREPVRVGNGVH